jgi:hypothetical protein
VRGDSARRLVLHDDQPVVEDFGAEELEMYVGQPAQDRLLAGSVIRGNEGSSPPSTYPHSSR